MNLSLPQTATRRWAAACLPALLALALFGCAAAPPNSDGAASDTDASNATEAEADPTVVPIFEVERTPVAQPDASGALTPEPTVAAVFSAERATPVPNVSLTAAATDATLLDEQSTISSTATLEGEEGAPAEATLRSNSDDYAERLIYDDVIDDNWTLDNSFLIRFDPLNTAHWFEPLIETTVSGNRAGSADEASAGTPLTVGAVAIEVRPEENYGALFFTVRPDATERYPLDEVLGFSFWLNSGPQVLDTADLAVTVLGSNELPYWEAGDDSVFGELSNVPDAETFSETRLYFLDINRSIPPDTWTRVFLWLDELEFEPNYEYVTGFYIKNNEGFLGTFYIDQLSLLVLPEAGTQ